MLRHVFSGKALPKVALFRVIPVYDFIIRYPDLRLFDLIKHKLQSILLWKSFFYLLLVGLIHPLCNFLSLLLFKLAEAFIHLKQTSVHHLMLTHNAIISSGLHIPVNLRPNKDIFRI